MATSPNRNVQTSGNVGSAAIENAQPVSQQMDVTSTTPPTVEHPVRFEPWEDMTDVLQDNQWHAFYESSSTEKPYYRVMCRRKDGTQLGMSLKQYRAWQTASETAQRLHDTASGCSKQIERDHRPTSLQPGCKNPSCRMCPASTTEVRDVAVNIKIGSGTSHDLAEANRANELRMLPIDEPLSKLALDLRGQKNYQTQMIYPPCYCAACSGHNWPYNGFRATAAHNVVAPLVERIVSKTLESSAAMAEDLRKFEKTMRRRWAKKNVDQRRNMLLKVYNDFPYYKKFAQIVRDYIAGRELAVDSSARSLFLAHLNLDDLAHDPDVLFDHLYIRAFAHPSKSFLVDYLRTRSADELEGMPHINVFGSFNITEAHYGKWQEWDDTAIHKFEAIAAAIAVQTFEAQYQTLLVLSRIVSALCQGLSSPATNSASNDRQCAPILHIRLPTFDDSESVFMKNGIIDDCFSEALQLTHTRLVQVTHDLLGMQADQDSLTRRLSTCVDFLQACNPKFATDPANLSFLLYSEPHDRVVSWSYIRKHFSVVQAARLNDNRAVFIRLFRQLAHLVSIRGRTLVTTILTLCKNVEKQEAVLPKALRGDISKAGTWLNEYYLRSPMGEDRVILSSFTRMHISRNAEHLPHVHEVVKDLIAEFATTIRVIELLMLHEPTVRPDICDTMDVPKSIYKTGTSYDNEKQSHFAQRQRALTPLLQIFKEPRCANLHWQTNNHFWSTYTDLAVKSCIDNGFSASYGETVRRVTAMTRPSIELDRSQRTEARVKSESSSPRKHFQKQRQGDTVVESTIPHHFGPDSPAIHKATKKRRDELNVFSLDFEARSELTLPADESPIQQHDPADVRIEIRRKHLPVVEQLFSNAQENVPDLRWDKFVIFLKDAGLEVETGQGVSVKFSGKNVLDGRNTALVIHRPHPEAVLKAVHMRNNTMKLREKFGWQEHMFVARQKQV